jgi:hypothetical protein
MQDNTPTGARHEGDLRPQPAPATAAGSGPDSAAGSSAGSAPASTIPGATLGDSSLAGATRGGECSTPAALPHFAPTTGGRISSSDQALGGSSAVATGLDVPPVHPPPVQPADAATDPPSTTANSRPITRLQHGIRKPKQYTDGTICYGNLASVFSEPTDLHEALSNPLWKAAMDNEISALMKNKTWHLVPPPRGGGGTS